MQVEVAVVVDKELLDLGNALFKLIHVGAELLKDGFQPGQDLPVFALEALQDLPVVLANLNDVAPSWKEDKAAFLLALGVAAQKSL